MDWISFSLSDLSSTVLSCLWKKNKVEHLFHYIPSVQVKDFNALTGGKPSRVVAIKNNEEKYEKKILKWVK